MAQKMGWLQQQGYNYADSLIRNYANIACAQKIENWRNRLTGRHDVGKVLSPSLSYRQAKMIVEYAKHYMLPMINAFLCDNER